MGVAISKNEALYNAAQQGRPQLVQELLRQGAAPDAFKDKKGRTALMMACAHAELYEVADVLLKGGANPKAYRPGKDGGFALHQAAKRGLERTTALLLRYGADPLAINDDGETALDCARSRGFTALVRLLEDRLCLFCGHMREPAGPALLEAINPWAYRKWWVVVLPVSGSQTLRPSRLELAMYSSPKAAMPKHVIALGVPPDVVLSKPNTPEASVTIVDANSKTKYKLCADKDSDNPSAAGQLYNACCGIPQGPGGPTSVASLAAYTAAAATGGGKAQEKAADDVALALAIEESLRTAAADGVPVPTPPPRNSNNWQHPSQAAGTGQSQDRYGGWGFFESGKENYNGWGSPAAAAAAAAGPPARTNTASPQQQGPLTPSVSQQSPAPPTTSASIAAAASWLPTPQGSHQGWGGSETSVPATNAAGAGEGSTGQASAPSAPPLTAEEAIHYPSLVDDDDASTSGKNARNGLCVVCMDAPIEAVCVPCGHISGCLSCFTEIKNKGWGCPVCRAPIDQVIKVYIASS